MKSNFLMEQTEFKVEDEKFLVFLLGGNNYGVPILDVSEINGLMPITPLPKAPKYFKGVINLRGSVIPVMDLRLKFGMEEKEHDEQTCIIIIKPSENTKHVGLIVDTVSEVFDLPSSQIEPPPNYGESQEEAFLSGIGKAKDKLVMLVDIKKIINEHEVINL